MRAFLSPGVGRRILSKVSPKISIGRTIDSYRCCVKWGGSAEAAGPEGRGPVDPRTLGVPEGGWMPSAMRFFEKLEWPRPCGPTLTALPSPATAVGGEDARGGVADH